MEPDSAVNFWLLDLHYVERDGKTIVVMYGLDDHGNRKTIEDSSLKPFFLSTHDIDIPTAIHTYQTKKIGGKPVEMVKYSFDYPRQVRDFRHLVPPESLYEADIMFTERFVYSRGINVSGWNLSSFGSITGNVGINPPPELRVMSLDFEMYNPGAIQPSPENCPIIMAGICSSNRPGMPEVIRMDQEGGELEMLRALTTRISEIDPHIIVTYGGSFFDLPYADTRWRVTASSDEQALEGLRWGVDGGSLRESQYDSWSMNGRPHIDLHSLVKQTLAQIHSAAVKPLTLKNVAREYLGVPNPIEMEAGKIARLWDSGQSGRDEIARYNASDARITLQLGLKLLPYAISLSNLTTLPLDHLFENSRGQQVDHYLMSLASQENEAIPMKPHGETHQKFPGADPRPPVPGLHENVFVMDFTSMYPNILMKLFPNSFLGKAARTLFDMKKRTPKETPEARGIKTVSLALWGYVGWDNARWKNFDQAATITGTGRGWIESAMKIAENSGVTIIYGHTDSVFGLEDGSVDLDNLAAEISKSIGSDIRVDKRYRKLMFVEGASGEGRINAYVGIDEKGKLDARGLDLLRGDVSLLGQVSQEGVTRIALYQGDIPRATRFANYLIRRVRTDGFPLGHYIIRKGLNKEDGYRVKTAHHEVASRIGAKPGSQIEFVIANGGGKLFQKAYHPSELPDSTASIDKEYYVRKQIVPPAMRILKMFGVDESDILTGTRSRGLDD